MVSATEIERATSTDIMGVYRGVLDGFCWDISESWSSYGSHYKIGVSRIGVRGSRKTIATRARWQNAAQIIADYINKLPETEKSNGER